MTENFIPNGTNLHQNIYPHKDIMNIKDIQGAGPEGHYTHTRNIDSNHIISEQIKNQPMHKSRQESYKKTIRNPLFNDYYYKDYQKQPQTAGNHGYQQKSSSIINDFPHNYPMPNKVPQTAKNLYGSTSSQSLPHFQRPQFQTADPKDLGSIYNPKPLRYDLKPLRDHGYPYPRGPNDIRPPISSPAGGDNIVSNIVGGTAGKKEILNFRALNGNSSLSNNYRQNMSQSALVNNNNYNTNQQNQNSNQQFQNIMENKSLVYPESRSNNNQRFNMPPSQQQYQKPQEYQNNEISQDIKNQFQKKSNLPDITADRQRAEAKAYGTENQNNNNDNKNHDLYNNFSTQPADHNKNNNQANNQQRLRSRQLSEKQFQNKPSDNFSEIYHQNFGYKNIQNRYIHNEAQQHIPRSEHIYKDVGDITGSIYKPTSHPNHKYAYGNFETKPNLDYMREHRDEKSGYSNKNWKPLNIISGKRHQQYTTTLKHDAWDWKLYDREQFKKWNGQKNHIKNIIKEKNQVIEKKPEFSTCNHEYGTAN